MQHDGSTQGPTWPMPQLRYQVDFGTDLQNVTFKEVSGMDVQPPVIDYRRGGSHPYSMVKMPVMDPYGKVILKSGVFVNDNIFWDWYSQITTNRIKRGPIVVKLLDETGKSVMQWTLRNARPIKISNTDIKQDGSEVSVDVIEIVHEGLSISG